ncbi:MAG TPA: hypothetical protein VFM82_05815 [Flavobacteriaceae bacterium]|nr:hypothetical protein [Flavobacteriaceae bacterium]
MPQNLPNDALDRKMGFIERMFDRFYQATQKDPKSFFIVILVATNLATFYLYADSLEKRLNENKGYSEEMIEEIRRKIMPEIDNRMDAKVEKIGKKVDSAAVGVNKLQKTINEAINVIR